MLPVFTAVAVLSLALAIGANTALFGLLDQLILPMLPVERDAAADLRLDDICVARRHARLTLADGRWSIEDAGGAGGTCVNDEIARAARPLDEGDVVQVAGVRLVVRLGAARR